MRSPRRLTAGRSPSSNRDYHRRPVTCPCTIWTDDSRNDRRGPQMRTDPQSSWASGSGQTSTGVITGVRFLQILRQQRHALSAHLWKQQRARCSDGDLRWRNGVGLATGHLHDAGRDDGEHHLRRVVSHRRRSLRRLERLLRQRPVRQRAAARVEDGIDGASGVYLYAAAPAAFRTRPTTRRTTGSTSCSHRVSAAISTPPTVASTAPVARRDTASPTDTYVTAVFSESLNPRRSTARPWNCARPPARWSPPPSPIPFRTATAILVPASPLANEHHLYGDRQRRQRRSARQGPRRQRTGREFFVVVHDDRRDAPPVCPARCGPRRPRPAVAAADRTPSSWACKFRTDVAGFITGLRFYKGAANTGTHTGDLWTQHAARFWPARPSSTRPPPAGSR